LSLVQVSYRLEYLLLYLFIQIQYMKNISLWVSSNSLLCSSFFFLSRDEIIFFLGLGVEGSEAEALLPTADSS
jgi:hypothetical protein